MRPFVGLVVLLACSDPALEMALVLPDDGEDWDTSCVQTIEVFTTGANYPEQANDYIGQTLDISDNRAENYEGIRQAVRDQFDVAIPESGLSAVEMYGWNGLSGFFPAGTFPELIFYSRVPYTGQDLIAIDLVPNLDCRTTNVTVRPIDLIALVTTKSCTMAAVTDPTGFASLGTLSPGLYKPYLFGWGGVHGAPVVNGVATFQASTTVGPQSCLAVYASSMTATTGQCVTTTKACATGTELEAVLIDDIYAQSSLDTDIQETFRGGIIGAVLDGTKTGIAGATVELPPDQGQVVYVNIDVATKRLAPVSGATATTASGMFIVYTNDIAPATVSATVNGTRSAKTVSIGGQRTLSDGTRLPAGVVVTF